MSRRGSGAAEAAASAASEAARVMQQRGQEVRQERAAEPEPEQQPVQMDEGRIERLRKNRTHVRVMDDIVKSRPGYAEQEAAASAPPDEKPAPKAEEKPSEKPKAEETPAKAPEKPQEPPASDETTLPSTTAPTASEAVKTVRVKVDGEEFDAPEEEVNAYGGLRPYQIAKAQENRLKKINDALADVQRRAADWSKQQLEAAKPKEPQQTDAQFIASKVDTIRFGSPEESAAALQEILNRAAKPLDANTIVEQAAARLKHDQAVAEFDKEFVEIRTDPMLVQLAHVVREQKFKALRESGHQGPIDWKDFYFKIGHEIRSKFGRQSQPAQASASAVTAGNPSLAASDKEARKASIVNLPSSAARAEAPKEDVPETREQIIANMRKSRGQVG